MDNQEVYGKVKSYLARTLILIAKLLFPIAALTIINLILLGVDAVEYYNDQEKFSNEYSWVYSLNLILIPVVYLIQAYQVVRNRVILMAYEDAIPYFHLAISASISKLQGNDNNLDKGIEKGLVFVQNLNSWVEKLPNLVKKQAHRLLSKIPMYDFYLTFSKNKNLSNSDLEQKVFEKIDIFFRSTLSTKRQSIILTLLMVIGTALTVYCL